jgi:hypothetical protein
MKSLRLFAFVLIFLWVTTWSVSLIGCSGGGANVKQETYTTTLGQELQDLQEAYQKGILTEKEFEKAKEALITQRSKK